MDIVDRLLEKPYRRGDENNDQAALRRQAEREEAAAEIERLREIENDWQAMRDERDAARTGYDNLLDENRGLVKLESENERLRTENQRLREALEPFASNFDHADGRQGWPDNSPAGGLNFPVITNGHLRRARAALSGKTEDDRNRADQA